MTKMSPTAIKLAEQRKRIVSSSGPNASRNGRPQHSFEIESHLRFVEEQLKWQYIRGSASINDMESMLAAIRQRHQDPALYLCAVGNASAGKSTFINALLRDDLLTVDNLLGTTAAATIIRNHTALDATVTFQNGETVSFLKDGLSGWRRFWRDVLPPSNKREKGNIREFVRRFTCDEGVAKNVREVSLLHPSTALANGLVIIDSPGVNARNKRHAEVTRRTISDQSDVGVILVAPDDPASDTFCKYLKEHLKDVLHHCVFLVTKADNFRQPKDRQKFVDNLKARLSRELEITDPCIHVAAPEVFLSDSLNRPPAEYDRLDSQARKQFVKEFQDVEQAILGRLRQQRDIIILEKLIRLMDRLMERLAGVLRSRDEEFRREHEALEKNRIPNLDAFIKERKDKHSDALTPTMTRLKGVGRQCVQRIRSRIDSRVRDAINGAESKGNLRYVLENNVKEIVSKAGGELQTELQTEIGPLYSAVDKEHKAFHEEFQRLYRNVATLGGQLSPDSSELSRLTIAGTVTGTVSNLSSRITEASNGQAAAVIGGGLGAGVLGQILIPIPGVGFALGAILGGIIGGLFGPSLDELKSKARNEVCDSLRTGFSSLETDAERAVSDAISRARRELERNIEQYFDKYRELVAEMQARDAKKKKSLEQLRRDIEVRLGTIEQHRSQLQTTLHQVQAS